MGEAASASERVGAGQAVVFIADAPPAAAARGEVSADTV
jgi:hypothetical protein